MQGRQVAEHTVDAQPGTGQRGAAVVDTPGVPVVAQPPGQGVGPRGQRRLVQETGEETGILALHGDAQVHRPERRLGPQQPVQRQLIAGNLQGAVAEPDARFRPLELTPGVEGSGREAGNFQCGADAGEVCAGGRELQLAAVEARVCAQRAGGGELAEPGRRREIQQLPALG